MGDMQRAPCRWGHPDGGDQAEARSRPRCPSSLPRGWLCSQPTAVTATAWEARGRLQGDMGERPREGRASQAGDGRSWTPQRRALLFQVTQPWAFRP